MILPLILSLATVILKSKITPVFDFSWMIIQHSRGEYGLYRVTVNKRKKSKEKQNMRESVAKKHADKLSEIVSK